jgi:hypothetical protein
VSGTPKLGTVCPSPYPLWSGWRAALADPRHCDLPLLNSYLPYRPPRGTCEIQGASPNLWFAVVPALGFWISSIRFPDCPFVDLCGAVCPGALILAATPRRCNRLHDVVFLDLLLLPLVSRLATTYWRAWAVSHVFFVWGGDTDLEARGGRGRLAQVAPQPPLGWTVRDVGLTHCEAGGATSGSWWLVVWYLPSRSAPSPAPLDPLPWFPICSSVLDRLAATPVRACLPCTGRLATGGSGGAPPDRQFQRGARVGGWGSPPTGASPCVGSLHPCPPLHGGQYYGFGHSSSLLARACGPLGRPDSHLGLPV